jgi:hypothetical protein
MQHVLGILSAAMNSAASAEGDENTMAASYIELLQKLQAQTLESLKQIQNVQVATLTTTREMVASLPTMTSVPTIESMPSVAQIAEINTQFASQLLDQQKAYATQLAELFTPAPKSSVN